MAMPAYEVKDFIAHKTPIMNPGADMDVTLIDVNVHKQSIMLPREFIKTFGDLNIAEPIYQGKAGPQFVESVRDGSLPGITFEGVVCKAAPHRKGHLPYMFKVKTRAWLDRLKNYCGEDDRLFERLA